MCIFVGVMYQFEYFCFFVILAYKIGCFYSKKKPTKNVAKAANKATEKDANKAAGDTASETLVKDNLTKANSIDDSADKKAKA